MAIEDIKVGNSESTEQEVNYDLTPDEQQEADKRLEKEQNLAKQTEQESEEAQKIATKISKELKEGGVEEINSNYKLYNDWIKESKNDIDGLEIEGYKISTEKIISDVYAKRDLATWFTDLIGDTRNYLIREEVYRFIVAIKDGMKRRCIIGEDGKIYFQGDNEFEKQLENDDLKYAKSSYRTTKKIKVDTPNTYLGNMGNNSPLSHIDNNETGEKKSVIEIESQSKIDKEKEKLKKDLKLPLEASLLSNEEIFLKKGYGKISYNGISNVYGIPFWKENGEYKLLKIKLLLDFINIENIKRDKTGKVISGEVYIRAGDPMGFKFYLKGDEYVLDNKWSAIIQFIPKISI